MEAVTVPLARPDATVRRHRRAAPLAVVIAAAGGVACALSVAAPAFHGLPLHPLDQTIHAGVAAAYVGAGVIALLRRPANATGLLMAAVGFLWLVQDLYWIWAPLPVTIAATYEQLYEAVLANLALVFPTGRFPGSFERRAMAGIYAWTLGNNLVRMLFYDPRYEGCGGCPRNLLKVTGDAASYHLVEDLSSYGSLVVVAFATAVIVRHWRRATRAARRVMAPVLWVVGPAVAFIVADELQAVVTFPLRTQHAIVDYLPAGLAVLPIGFLIGLLRTRLAYAQVGALLPELAGPVSPGGVRAALAAALHDPDLELLYWSPAAEDYVDGDGRARTPAAPAGRALSPIDGDSGRLAVMIVDEVALDEPDLLRSVVALARFALENERLQAEVRAQLLLLRDTTARIVEAGQDARRRLERDLHDGAQQQLLALAMSLSRARARAAAAGDTELRTTLDHAADDLRVAIGELRELARGIHPVLLQQEGVGPALHALAERAPLPIEVSAPPQRFPPTVEATAYFLAAEAVTNAARHSGATLVRIRVGADGADLVLTVSDDGVGGVDAQAAARGSGLTGMRDRAVALGGTLRVASAPGAGTTVTARLPCG